MTFVLIHNRGTVRRIEDRKAEPIIDKRQVQRPKGFWPMWREWKMPLAHNGYRPGRIEDMGADQCRFIPGDDHVMCGRKVKHDKTSYCEEHHDLCHTRKDDGRK